MEIILDPRVKYNYSTFYIVGLEKLYPKQKQKYEIAPFLDLTYNNIHDYNSGMPFVIKNDDHEYKFFIDFEDVPNIVNDRYEWCDVYAKINVNKEDICKYDKLLPIGPSFGITVQGNVSLILNAFIRYVKSIKHFNISFKMFLKDYLYTTIRRRSLEEYITHVGVKENYIFHASTLWYNEFAGSDTNKFRGTFLLACQDAGLIIEGGFFYLGETPAILKEMPDYAKYKYIYKDFIYEKRLKMEEYIQKTKASVLVFNTPSVCGCHGWKLAEYLCMGKAIISTPLLREMPVPLEHGKHVHFVKSSEDIYEAVVKISNDRQYRRQLEYGARAYYEKWLKPERVIQRILNKSLSNK